MSKGAQSLPSPCSQPQSSAVSSQSFLTWASFPPVSPPFWFPGLSSGLVAGMVRPCFLTSGGRLQVPRLHPQGGGGTYNVHDGQHVLLHVPAPVVGHHHLVRHHQRLHVALSADRALQAWLAALRLIPQRPGRWRLQGTQPPRPPLPRLLVWMDDFLSFCCLP